MPIYKQTGRVATFSTFAPLSLLPATTIVVVWNESAIVIVAQLPRQLATQTSRRVSSAIGKQLQVVCGCYRWFHRRCCAATMLLSVCWLLLLLLLLWFLRQRSLLIDKAYSQTCYVPAQFICGGCCCCHCCMLHCRSRCGGGGSSCAANALKLKTRSIYRNCNVESTWYEIADKSSIYRSNQQLQRQLQKKKYNWKATRL